MHNLSGIACDQAVTKRCRLYCWLTNSAIVYEPKCGVGGVAGSQPERWILVGLSQMSTAMHRAVHMEN
jgi:hypothetical protein